MIFPGKRVSSFRDDLEHGSGGGSESGGEVVVARAGHLDQMNREIVN